MHESADVGASDHGGHSAPPGGPPTRGSRGFGDSARPRRAVNTRPLSSFPTLDLDTAHRPVAVRDQTGRCRPDRIRVRARELRRRPNVGKSLMPGAPVARSVRGAGWVAVAPAPSVV